MADAIVSFKDAYSSYTKGLADYAIYSVIMNLVGAVVFLMMLAALVVMGVLSIGSITNFLATGAGISVSTVGFGATLLTLFIGFLIVAWIASGLIGTYLRTVNTFLSGGKQTLVSFFSAIPKHATKVLAVMAIVSIMVWVPVVLLSFVSTLTESLISTAILVLAAVYAIFVLLLMFLSVPAAAVDSKPPIPALRASISISARNIVAIVLFVVIAGLLAIPSIFPIFGFIYFPLFYLPFTTAALVSFYKQAR